MDKNKEAVEVFDKHAKMYQEKYMDVSLYHDTLDIFCNSIAKNDAAILELACGPGNVTRYLLNKRPDLKILATDLSENMLELAVANNPAAEIQLLDCRAIGQLDKAYDGIICGFALPYLSKEEAIQLISDAAKILQPGGVLYLSTMEDDYSKSGMQTSSAGDQLFVHYHQADYLIAALESNNFKIIDERHQDYPTNDGTKMFDLVIVAQKSNA
ncbi:MAG: SAM-dependent methyltransferase [Flavipsychrobacter sp.]|nr:SAM-dependent methyltransferase [Flavipsychrobacter sp.]